MNSGVKHFLRYQFPALFWALVIFIASSIPGAKLPKIANLINDKIIHIGIFLVFGLLVYRALEPRIQSNILSWKRILFSIAIVVFYGLSDELHQGFVPGRSLDVRDLTADTFGGILAATIIYFRHQKKNPPTRDKA